MRLLACMVTVALIPSAEKHVRQTLPRKERTVTDLRCQNPCTWLAVLFGITAAMGFATVGWAADQIVTGTLTIRDSSPKLVFDDNSSPLQSWTTWPDAAGFDIIDDTNGGRPFRIYPSSGTDRLVLRSRGIGIGKDNPNADLHILPKDNGFGATMILQARSSGGSASRQWVVRGGEDHFNIEDLTGSARPFIVQAGTAANALFLASNSSVGLGTPFPTQIGNVSVAGRYLNLRTDATGLDGLARMVAQGKSGAQLHLVHNDGPVNQRVLRIQNVAGITSFGVVKDDLASNLVSNIIAIKNLNGNIGFKVANPLHPLHLVSGAHCSSGGVWTNASSRELKHDIAPLTSEQAQETVQALQPVEYRYNDQSDEKYVGFIAEDVPDLVATNDRKSLSPMDVVAVLTKVVQDQNRQLNEQRTLNKSLIERLNKLEQQMPR